MEIGYCDPMVFNALLTLRKDRQISWRAVGLGMVIANFANQDGEAWPSRAILSAITGIDKADISNTARELREAGFLTLEERVGQSTIYYLTRRRFTTGGDLPPVGVSPPITIYRTIKEQYAQNDEKPPSSSASEAANPTTSKLPTRTPKPKVKMGDTGFIIPDAIRHTWTAAYPDVDIDREAAKAFAWCLNNPRKAPKKDFGRFLNSWLGRARPSSPENGFDSGEHIATDAELIRGAEIAFDTPEERAHYWWVCKNRGEYVPSGVECRPMPDKAEVV